MRINVGDNWWGRWDSNPHAKRHMILSHACLPIPAHPRLAAALYGPSPEHNKFGVQIGRASICGTRADVAELADARDLKSWAFGRVGSSPTVGTTGGEMDAPAFDEENCENCIYLTAEDTCGCQASVYFQRPTVYRDGTEVLQTGWCEHWRTHTSPGDN